MVRPTGRQDYENIFCSFVAGEEENLNRKCIYYFHFFYCLCLYNDGISTAHVKIRQHVSFVCDFKKPKKKEKKKKEQE